MAFLKARDILSGQEGVATATIDGRIYELFNLKSLEATIEKTKTDVKTMGKRVTQYKATGAEMTGSLEYYTGTASTVFTKLISDYVKNGTDTYFTMTVTNADPTSTIGKRTIVLYGVNINSIKITQLDVESEGLTEDLEFTFDNFEVLDEFGEPLDLGN